MSFLSTALSGLDEARNHVNKVARNLANMPLSDMGGDTGDSVDLSSEAVSLLQAQAGYEVTLLAMESIGETDRRTLDLLA